MLWKSLENGLLPGLALLVLAILAAYWVAPSSPPKSIGPTEEIVLFDPPDGHAEAYFAEPGTSLLRQLGAGGWAFSRKRVAELRDSGKLDPGVLYYVLLALGEGDERAVYHVEMRIFHNAIHYARQQHGGRLTLARGFGERVIWNGTAEALTAAIMDTLALPRGANPEALP